MLGMRSADQRCRLVETPLLPALVAGVLLLWSAPTIAQSDPGFEAARTAFHDARLEQALDAYDALYRRGLDVEDLRILLAERAVVAHAFGQRDRADSDLRALLSIDPDAQLGPQAPPSLRRRLDALREGAQPLQIDANAVPSSDGWRITLSVRGDSGSLVQDTQVEVRDTEGWHLHETESRQLFLPDTESQVLEFRAVAIGFSGRRLLVGETRRVARPGGGLEEERFDRRGGLRSNNGWKLGLGIGAALVFLVVLSATLAVRAEAGGVRPSPPREIR